MTRGKSLAITMFRRRMGNNGYKRQLSALSAVALLLSWEVVTVRVLIQ